MNIEFQILGQCKFFREPTLEMKGQSGKFFPITLVQVVQELVIYLSVIVRHLSFIYLLLFIIYNLSVIQLP